MFAGAVVSLLISMAFALCGYGGFSDPTVAALAQHAFLALIVCFAVFAIIVIAEFDKDANEARPFGDAAQASLAKRAEGGADE
jgi:hypothetical protein